ncbi:MAG: cytochrome P450 [Cyanobacteria bacterium J06626_6]
MSPPVSPNASATPLPPGKMGLPLLGETLSFFRDADYANRKHERYGDIFKTRLLGAPTVFMCGAEANEFVLTQENEYFQVSWPPSTKALLGDLSLALQTGQEHKDRRKLLAQAFMPRALTGYIDDIAAITRDYAERWQAQRQLTWYPQLRDYTLDVACKLLVGLDQGSKTELGEAFETWCAGLFSIPLAVLGTPFARAKRCRATLLELIEEIILLRQRSPAAGTDALGLLLQARDEKGEGLSVAELKDQILLLLFAGHETLTSAIASFCLLTAQNPTVLAALRKEQSQFLDTVSPTLEDLKQMTYLDRVLQEVLRYVSPVGGGFRKVLKECEVAGYRIPKDWNVLYEIQQTHSSPAEYNNPKQFQPERFDADTDEKRKKYSYIPFGGGIRECLGKEFARLEMKLFAVHLLRYYQWALVPSQDLSMVVVPTPHPRDNLKVIFSQFK